MPYIAQAVVEKLKCLHLGMIILHRMVSELVDYIHVVDFTLGHVKAIEKLETAHGHIYNLGTGKGYSVLDVLLLRSACGKTIPYECETRRAGDIPTCYADPAKASAVFSDGLLERGIEEMCEDSWRWQSMNPGWV